MIVFSLFLHPGFMWFAGEHIIFLFISFPIILIYILHLIIFILQEHIYESHLTWLIYRYLYVYFMFFGFIVVSIVCNFFINVCHILKSWWCFISMLFRLLTIEAALTWLYLNYRPYRLVYYLGTTFVMMSLFLIYTWRCSM